VAALRAHGRAHDAFDQAVVEQLGINRTDGRCVDILDEFGPLTAGELARAVGLTTGAVTTMLDRLERAGLVRRRPDPADRRKVMVEVTELAREHVFRIFGPLVEEGTAMLDRFSDDELAAIVEFAQLNAELQERHAARLQAAPGAVGGSGAGAAAHDL
jgi:DNA-binding MarR family transcriptional regulator